MFSYVSGKLNSSKEKAKKAYQKLTKGVQSDNVIEQTCLRPCLTDAVPMMGRVLENAVIATGHNCWVKCFFSYIYVVLLLCFQGITWSLGR